MKERITMKKATYSPEYKAKLVMEVITGEKQLGEIASANGINPNMLRNWKNEFTENAFKVFNESTQEKQLRKKEEQLKSERETMLKSIGQLTLERDFLRQCCEKTGIIVEKKSDIN